MCSPNKNIEELAVLPRRGETSAAQPDARAPLPRREKTSAAQPHVRAPGPGSRPLGPGQRIRVPIPGIRTSGSNNYSASSQASHADEYPNHCRISSSTTLNKVQFIINAQFLSLVFHRYVKHSPEYLKIQLVNQN